jgi:hypothetical protein
MTNSLPQRCQRRKAEGRGQQRQKIMTIEWDESAGCHGWGDQKDKLVFVSFVIRVRRQQLKVTFIPNEGRLFPAFSAIIFCFSAFTYSINSAVKLAQ